MGVIAKQSVRGTLWTYVGVAIGFVTTFFVLTRFLAAEEIGLSRVLIDAATLFIGLAQLGTSASTIRFYPYFADKDGKTDHGFFFFTLVVPLVGFVIFALLFWALHSPIQGFFAEKSALFVDYYYLVLPIAFFMLYQTIFETNSNVLMRIVFPRAVREVVVRVGMLAVYLLYAFKVLTMDGFVWGICSVYGVAAVSNLIYLLHIEKISFRPDWSYINRDLVRNYLFYTLFLLSSAVVSVLAPSLSSFFITAKMGLNFTGVFAIATYMAVMVAIPCRSVVAIAQPELARAIKENDQAHTEHLLGQVATNMLLICGLIFCAIWVNIDLIFRILPNGATYAVAKNTVFVLGLSQLLIGTFNITLHCLNYSRYYYLSLFFSLLLTVSAIVLNNMLIPRLGMDGAAMANLLSYAIYFLGLIVTLRIALKTNVFSLSFLKIAGLLLVILVLDYVWRLFLAPYITNLWFDTLLRDVMLFGLAAVVVLKGHLSKDVDALLRSIFIQRH